MKLKTTFWPLYLLIFLLLFLVFSIIHADVFSEEDLIGDWVAETSPLESISFTESLTYSSRQVFRDGQAKLNRDTSVELRDDYGQIVTLTPELVDGEWRLEYVAKNGDVTYFRKQEHTHASAQVDGRDEAYYLLRNSLTRLLVNGKWEQGGEEVFVFTEEKFTSTAHNIFEQAYTIIDVVCEDGDIVFSFDLNSGSCSGEIIYSMTDGKSFYELKIGVNGGDYVAAVNDGPINTGTHPGNQTEQNRPA